MINKFRFPIILAAVVLLAPTVFAQGIISTVKLEQVHFLLDPASTNICDLVVFRDLDGEIVSSSQISTQIVDRVSDYCDVILPSISVRDTSAAELLGFLIDMPNMSVQGSIGIGTATLQGSQGPGSFPWVQALSLNDYVVSVENVSRVYYLEMIDRLAQFLEIKTGVLESGDLIYGTLGNWATNYVPLYTLELNVKYEEDRVGQVSRLCGDEYIAARDMLLSGMEPEQVEELRAMRDDVENDWNIRAQAGILVERYESNAEFVALIETNWLEDPEFDEYWMGSKIGPLGMVEASHLRMRRYREGGFWYHYFEHLWKDITTPGHQHRLYGSSNPDFGAQWAIRMLGWGEPLTYHGPDEFRFFLFQWAVEQAETGEIIGDRDRRTSAAPRPPRLPSSRDWIWNILSSNNSRESRRAQVEMLKRYSGDDVDLMLIRIIGNAEYKDEADLYEAFFDEHVKKELTDSPTMVSFIEELIAALRQKD